MFYLKQMTCFQWHIAKMELFHKPVNHMLVTRTRNQLGRVDSKMLMIQWL